MQYQMFRHYRLAVVLLALLFLVSLGESTLTVYNWQALGSNDPSLQNISYSIANYGFAPLGKTIVGKLVHSPNFGEECTPAAESGVNYENSFLLIPRGECEFVTKTLNAQKLGAQMAIIMDDKEHKGSVIMADNGYGYKITIPSIFINYQAGELLKDLLLNNEGQGTPDVLLKVTFDNQKTEKVDFALFLQSNNRQSYRFVESFRKHYKLLKDYINFKPVFSTLKCLDCPPTDCYHGQDYCAFNYLHGQGASGRLILDQQLREQLLFELYPDQWWEYMQYVGDQCAVISELQTCQEKALEKLGLNPEELQDAFKKSFSQSQENNVLAIDREHLFLAGITRFPSVTLNRVKLRGNLQAEFVFDDICNTLISPPTECKKYVGDQTVFQREVSMQWPTLVLVIAGGLLVFSLVFCLYRRHMKRKISAEMQGRVDDMVSKYIEFYSERNK